MKTNKKSKLLLMAVILTVVLASCALPSRGTETTNSEPVLVFDTSMVSATGVIVPAKYAALSVSSAGHVDEVHVVEGQTVTEGTALLTLGEIAQAEARLAMAQLDLTTAQQAYDEFVRTEGLGRADAWQAYMDAQIARAEAEEDWEALNIDSIDDRIEDSDADITDLKSDLEDAQEEFDKYKDLDEDNSKRKSAEDDLENAQEKYNEAVRNFEEAVRERDTVRAALESAIARDAEAKHDYEQTLDGPNAEQLAVLEARLENAKAQAASAQAQVDNLSLTAPFAGTVADLNVRAGEWAMPGQTVVMFADLKNLQVETTDLNETDVAKVKVGDVATITFDALPDVSVTGVVTSVSPKASSGSGVNYTVVIELDEIPEGLLWGMTAYVDIESLE